MRLFVAVLAFAVTACAAGPRYDGPRLEDRANPTEVVATELAFARTAQEEGQWTAFRKYAADGALIFGRNGAIEAEPFLKAQDDPPASVAWEPHAVWASCDGSIAVTQGGFRDPEGTVGVFNTVWQRQRGGKYRWVFDFGYPTDTAPVAPEFVNGDVADCEAAPAPVPDGPAMALRRSRDNTLAWGFHFTGEGTRRYAVWLARAGVMEQVIDIEVARQAQ